MGRRIEFDDFISMYITPKGFFAGQWCGVIEIIPTGYVYSKEIVQIQLARARVKYTKYTFYIYVCGKDKLFILY